MCVCTNNFLLIIWVYLLNSQRSKILHSLYNKAAIITIKFFRHFAKTFLEIIFKTIISLKLC